MVKMREAMYACYRKKLIELLRKFLNGDQEADAGKEIVQILKERFNQEIHEEDIASIFKNRQENIEAEIDYQMMRWTLVVPDEEYYS